MQPVIEMVRALKEGIRVLGLELGQDQIDQFVRFYAELVQWNRMFNLTALTEPQDVAEKHFLDSLIICCVVNFPAGAKVIDVGSGAGFPGVPLAVWRPDLEVVLLEVTEKKAAFLRQLVKELAIKVCVINMRAELAGRKGEYREQFDCVLSRAVAPAAVLAEYCLPLTRIGGFTAWWKGPLPEKELSAAQCSLQTMGGLLVDVHRLALPLSGIGRSIIRIRKIRGTPENYPRRAGVPAKRPLGVVQSHGI